MINAAKPIFYSAAGVLVALAVIAVLDEIPATQRLAQFLTRPL